ncbi:MAG: aminotransferase class I/II-fold pyridoxal phosphate-dependent enzyme [Actinomycetota bacterium]|nr:aminotransferase class I/II-fold pyridoxal phosphate-dependent enzyme [Actinomycetota bacterium]
MRISPTLAGMATYPFVHLDEARRRLLAEGRDVLDFGKGDPQEATDDRIRRALVESLTERSTYPLADGLPELREAAAGWVARRFGVELDPDREIVPTYGSREAIFSLASVLVDRASEKRLVVTTEPGYPVAARGAAFAGADTVALPLRAENGFLPDLDSVDEATWRRAAIVWVNYPNNPTGATAPLAFYERLAELAARHDFALASDEAYSELWFDEPPASALQVRDRARVIAFHTLSKRSSMTGYRSGFVAAAPDAIAALKAYRPSAGTAPQEFVQRASVVAWNDEEHVARTRETYRRKRDVLVPVLERKGLRVAGGAASMYLWLRLPDGAGGAEAFARRLLDHAIVVSPGTFFGPSGEGYIRVALVPTEDECARGVELLEDAL